MATALAERWRPVVEALGVKRPGDIGWIHGANNTQALLGALSDTNVHFIEGDISVVDGKIIMAHPPVTESDLGFERWLDLTVDAGKGAKLDFKSPEAVTHCLNYAKQHAQGKIPLCVNADILAGPGGVKPVFKPEEFVGQCIRNLPQAFLSLGWTVEEGELGYTKESVDEMLSLLVDVEAAVSLCFHAGYLRNARARLEEILEETDYTFTIWGRIEDQGLLSWIRANTPPGRCFYDIQWKDGTQIHLTSE